MVTVSLSLSLSLSMESFLFHSLSQHDIGILNFGLKLEMKIYTYTQSRAEWSNNLKDDDDDDGIDDKKNLVILGTGQRSGVEQTDIHRQCGTQFTRVKA